MAKKEKSNLKKDKLRKAVNYILFLIVVVLVCLLCVKVYNNYKNREYQESVLNQVIGSISLDDLSNATTELVSDDFIVISYTGSKETRTLEKSIKKIILDNDLQNNFYYLDATDIMLEENYLDLLNKEFKLDKNNKIDALPAIVYYKNGKVVETLSSTNDKIISTSDFKQLLIKNKILESK